LSALTPVPGGDIDGVAVRNAVVTKAVDALGSAITSINLRCNRCALPAFKALRCPAAAH
jgi:hypothetical protein